ncbi:unnamed protein product [Discula destructiva]
MDNTPLLLLQQLQSTRPDSADPLDQAIATTLEEAQNKAMASAINDLVVAKRLHDADLFNTQQGNQGKRNSHDSVLVFVKFLDSASKVSCGGLSFQTAAISLPYQSILDTGSVLLKRLLEDAQYQRRAKKAAPALDASASATHFLNMSPTTDEEDYILALQNLSLTKAVKLWHRFSVWGTSPLTVAGHDDVCPCLPTTSDLLHFDSGYPLVKAPSEIQSPCGAFCIFDTELWPVDTQSNIDDFCTTRWAANTIRLFRAIAMPTGHSDLLIDSAPRLWTLVGLFTKLEMTKCDLLRDRVAAWFNADGNSSFIELCPEESLRIGLALKIPMISEPAFRILVNERALEVAGGQPRPEPTKTIFGRRCTSFTGTDAAEQISRMIEHASVGMAERYKVALNRLRDDDALDMLSVSQWYLLRALYDYMVENTEDSSFAPVHSALKKLMDSIHAMYLNAVDAVINCNGTGLPISHNLIRFAPIQVAQGRGPLTVEDIDDMRAFSVPRNELLDRPFVTIYNSLDQYQRALTPFIWQGLRSLDSDSFTRSSNDPVGLHKSDLLAEVDNVRHMGNLPQYMVNSINYILQVVQKPTFLDHTVASILNGLREYIDTLTVRDKSFHYRVTGHLVLALSDHEMNFLRLGNEEGTFQAEAPETDMGPSGPGPAFHTGRTVASVCELDLAGLALSDDGTSTVMGSVAAQDGLSTVHDRHRVLARSAGPSVASEQFTDESDEYADAEYALPAEHQARGQALAQIIEQEEEYEREDQEEEYESDYDDVYGDYSGSESDEEDVIPNVVSSKKPISSKGEGDVGVVSKLEEATQQTVQPEDLEDEFELI